MILRWIAGASHGPRGGRWGGLCFFRGLGFVLVPGGLTGVDAGFGGLLRLAYLSMEGDGDEYAEVLYLCHTLVLLSAGVTIVYPKGPAKAITTTTKQSYTYKAFATIMGNVF